MDLNNKTVLVTGGTGSFGNKVAKYLQGLSPKKIIIYSRDEKKQYDMQKLYPDYQYIIGDVRDKDRLIQACKKVNFIFHAAALKHVPACENYPYEAVKTNIIGSNNICEAAIYNGVEKVVALSTDKAVKPINAMGLSKSMMEKLICSQNQQDLDTVFCCVRYGNVMGSRGSVIPFFRQLLEEKKPLTITDEKMTRFMMTLDESVDLVLYAMNNAKGGEVFVKKAPACLVTDLARTMIKKYSDGDISKIKVVGIRPGEKIDEVLVNEYEIRRSKENEQFFVVSPEYRPDGENHNYISGYEYTSANTKQLTKYEEISDLLTSVGENDYFN
jgi:UDP-N-acetylglucosamine 4,6-dehydratase/5-epimerase